MDEAFSLFDDGFGVKKSRDMRTEKSALQKQLNEVEAPVDVAIQTAKADGALLVEDKSQTV